QACIGCWQISPARGRGTPYDRAWPNCPAPHPGLCRGRILVVLPLAGRADFAKFVEDAVEALAQAAVPGDGPAHHSNNRPFDIWHGRSLAIIYEAFHSDLLKNKSGGDCEAVGIFGPCMTSKPDSSQTSA